MSCAVMYQPCISAATDTMSAVLNKPLQFHQPHHHAVGHNHQHHHAGSAAIARPLPVSHHHLSIQQQHQHHHLHHNQLPQESQVVSTPSVAERTREIPSLDQEPPQSTRNEHPSPKKSLGPPSNEIAPQHCRSPLERQPSQASLQRQSHTSQETLQSEPSSAAASVSPSPNQLVQNEGDVKYLSANCVLVTNYRGDTSSVVDEHFSRALAAPSKRPQKSFLTKGTSPSSNRSFPASFYQPPSTSRHIGGAFSVAHANELYETYHGTLHSFQGSSGAADPWTYSLASQAYGHRAVGTSEMYHPSMGGSHPYQYSSLGFQQTFGRFPSMAVPSQMKAENWSSRYYDAFAASADFSSPAGMDAGYSSAHYSGMSGLEGGMTQECSKDLYWL